MGSGTSSESQYAETLCAIRSDQNDPLRLVEVERQKIIFVFQQHHTLLGCLTGYLLMLFGVDRGAGFQVFMIEDSGFVFDPEDPADHFVEDRFGNFTPFDGFHQRFAEKDRFEIAPRHVDVESGQRSLDGRPGVAEVGEDETLESPLFFQDFIEQPLVVAAQFAVQSVCGGHAAPRIGLFDSDLISAQIDFAQRTFVHAAHVPVSVEVATVDGEVFDTGRYPFPLHASYLGCSQFAVQVGIFCQIFEKTASQRIAVDVECRAEDHTDSSCTAFRPDHLSGLFDELRIPSGGETYS